MNSYTFEYWFRYGYFQKDFDRISIKSESEEVARKEVEKLNVLIYKIDLISKESCLDV